MTRTPRDLPGSRGKPLEESMKSVIKETVFFVVAAVIILPTPTLILAYMTNQTIWEVLYR